MSERFVLRPRPPIRALAISAGVDVIAVVWLAIASAFGSTALVVFALILLAVGLGLGVTTLIGYQRLTTVVEADERGIAIRSAGQEALRRWGEINQVRAQADRMYLWTDDDNGDTLQIVCPRGSSDPEAERLALMLARRLDQNRGYQSFGP